MEQMRERVARDLQSRHAGNHPVIHCNRMPSWDEVSHAEQYQWLATADAVISEIDRRVAEERAKQQTIADALWNAETALSVFEDQLYDRLGGDAVEPFSHIGHDHYDRSIEIYDLCKSVTLSDDDRAFIHAAGFATIYTDRKGDPDLSVKMRRKEKAKLLERLREPSEAMRKARDESDSLEAVWPAMLAQYEKEQQP